MHVSRALTHNIESEALFAGHFYIVNVIISWAYKWSKWHKVGSLRSVRQLQNSSNGLQLKLVLSKTVIWKAATFIATAFAGYFPRFKSGMGHILMGNKWSKGRIHSMEESVHREPNFNFHKAGVLLLSFWVVFKTVQIVLFNFIL